MTEPAAPKYRELRQIGDGGMAEVFMADMSCQTGYTKRVAVKRVLPRLARNQRFIRMFLDEARLGLLLNHANIVQVFDVGGAEGAYFIVMEYINGGNLRDIWELCAEKQTLIPLELSLAIGIEVCRALDYAHNLTDLSGQPLGVVHHDVNLSNIMLSTYGEVKLMDFGLSEAAVHAERTDPDILRGKFGYISPEAAHGLGADARSDQYALGIVLYEMVTGARLFQGKDDLDSLRLARAAEVPHPREVNPNIPDALTRALLRCLQRDPGSRFPSVRELGSRLTRILFELGRPVSAFAIGDFVQAMRAQMQPPTTERAAVIEQMIQEELARFEPIDESTSDLPPVQM